MGLAAAYQALVDGSDVDILEASAEPGGMAAHFDFGGISIERFYHFVCKTDQLNIRVNERISRIANKMRWVPTSMGFFSHGASASLGRSVLPVNAPRSQPGQQAAIWVLSSLSAPIAIIGLRWKICRQENGSHAIAEKISTIDSGIRCSTSNTTNMQTTSRLHGSGLGSAGLANREKTSCRRNSATSTEARKTLVDALLMRHRSARRAFAS